MCLFQRVMVFFLLCALQSTTFADDWPQWMGPDRASIWHEDGIVDRFPEEGLPVKWRTPVGLGYSGPAVAGGKVFVMDYLPRSGKVSNSPGGRVVLEGEERVLCFDAATGKLLDNNKSPGRKVGQLDNRGSHFYLALYWAQALAAQDEDAALQAHFQPIAKQLEDGEAKILDELAAAQGAPVDLGGYFRPDQAKLNAVMRPSPTLNTVIG